MNMTVDAAMAASMTDSRCWPNGTLGGILYEGREQFDDRHTHRGPFAPDPLPAGLLAGLQHDALAEGATLALVDRAVAYRQLADIVGATGSRQDLDPLAQAEVRRWSRDADDPARDGVPARAFPAQADRQAGRLPQRDFDLGRGLGLLDADGPPPAATRYCSRPVMAALTGFALVRRCIGCWRTLRASGCSRVCTRSRWRPPRSAP
jgi:hypothetical protein